MPMRYAVEVDVLSLTDITEDAVADSEYAQIVRLENAMCDVFDHKVGTSFGDAADDETRVIWIGNSAAPYFWPINYAGWALSASPRLILDMPVRSVTTIETGGTWTGDDWVDGTELDPLDYLLTNHTEQGSYAIDLLSGYWSGVVRITGVWADQITDEVPDDVAQALTEITVKEWHRRHMSPAGQIGPEEFAIRPGDPWNDSYVKAVIDRYRVVGLLV